MQIEKAFESADMEDFLWGAKVWKCKEKRKERLHGLSSGGLQDNHWSEPTD